MKQQSRFLKMKMLLTVCALIPLTVSAQSFNGSQNQYRNGSDSSSHSNPWRPGGGTDMDRFKNQRKQKAFKRKLYNEQKFSQWNDQYESRRQQYQNYVPVDAMSSEQSFYSTPPVNGAILPGLAPVLYPQHLPGSYGYPYGGYYPGGLYRRNWGGPFRW